MYISKSCCTVPCNCIIQYKFSISECIASQCFLQHPGLSILLHSHHCCGLFPSSRVQALHTNDVLGFPLPSPLFFFPSQLLHLHRPCIWWLVFFPLLILYWFVFLITGRSLVAAEPSFTVERNGNARSSTVLSMSSSASWPKNWRKVWYFTSAICL